MRNTTAVLAISIAALGCSKSENIAAPAATPSKRPALVQATPAPTPVPVKYDGPFGLAMGISPADLEKLGFKLISESYGAYSGKPPRPMEDVTSFVVIASKNAGLCRIRASVDVPVINGSGDQLKAAVDKLADTMQLKYGKHSAKYESAAELYRRNSQYWMLGLKEESVVYAYGWKTGKTEAALPVDIDRIEVGADATSTSTGNATMQYSFKNYEACMKEIKAIRAANL